MLPKVGLITGKDARYLCLVTDRGVSRDLKQTGEFSPQLTRIAVELFQKRGHGVVIDAGAHIGTFCIPVARATGCPVYAFEAQRVISQILAGNIVLNQIDNAVVEHVLLGGPGHPVNQTVMTVNYDVFGNFSAYTPDEELRASHVDKKMTPDTKQETVRVTTLDAYTLDDVFLIKLDVEGAELDVLKGATETLARNKFPPLLFEAWERTEWAARKRDLVNYIESLGYDITGLGNDNLAQHRDTPAAQRIAANP